jgi:hypothetical protein
MNMKDINPISLPSHGFSHCIVDVMSLRCLMPPTWTAQERVLSLLRVSMLNAATMLATMLQTSFFGILIPLLVLGVAVLSDNDNEDDVHQEECTQED